MPFNFNNPNLMNQLYRQKENIDNMINQYSQMYGGNNAQPPVQNIINTTGNTSDTDVRFLNPNEDVSNIIVTKRTLFINEGGAKISIKETDGTISKSYDIIIPKDEKDLKIEELENKIKELEEKVNDGYAKPTSTITNVKTTTASDIKPIKSATVTTF